MVTAGALLREGRERLLAATAAEGHACEGPRRDAEWLLLAAAGLDRAVLLGRPEQSVADAQAALYRAWIERRALGEPVQYIVGTQEFYGIPFTVNRSVLIPRPETEHLVEAALEVCRGLLAEGRRAPRIVDVGTGSGAIAVALSMHLTLLRIAATDISAAALDVARANAERNGVGGRILFFECDLLPATSDVYDCICSNPPYVAQDEALAYEVKAFEPHGALFAGPDGLAVYRRLIPLAAQRLAADGRLLLEIGHGQRAGIESLLAASTFKVVRSIADLQGIARVLIAARG